MASAGLSLSSILTYATATVVIGGGAFSLYQGAIRLYRRTVGYRRDLARRLNQLAAGVTSSYVSELFGVPTFARAFSRPTTTTPTTTPAIAEPPIRELVYRERHAWLQTLVDEHDAVVRFSITVTDPRFKFQIRDLTVGQLGAKLGRSRFAEVRTWSTPDGRSLHIGAHNHEYAEAYWFGNPANYQWYVLSSNDAGVGKFSMITTRQGFGADGMVWPGITWFQDGELALAVPPRDVWQSIQQLFQADQPQVRDFRAGTTVNTLTVLGPGQVPELLAEPRGPDSTFVWTLLPTGRDRWRVRRRIRHAERDARRITAQEEPSADTAS